MKTPTVRDRSMGNIQGEVAGHTGFSDAPTPPNAQVSCYDHENAEVATSEGEPRGLTAVTAATDGGGNVVFGPQAMEGKAQKPTTFNPNPRPQAKPGTTVHLGNGAPVTGAAVYNPNTGKFGAY